MRKGSKQKGQLHSKPRVKKLSRIHKPEDMSLEEWQVRLRQQFGREQNFLMENVGDHPILKVGYVPPFSEVYLCYGAHRQVVFSAGEDALEGLKKTKCYNSSLNE